MSEREQRLNAAVIKDPTHAKASARANAFPWASNGLTFRSRGEFERVVERFAGAGTKQHLDAAQKLLRDAQAQHKLSVDQIADIKERLHL